jgi:APA family basic amino acid/polyamine antiporter
MREHVVHLEKKSLRRVLGVGDLFAVGYGDVGSSIYYALGATALYAMGALPIALAIGGLIFICTALTYAEMASTFPEPGGSATFARHAFNDLISFIAGWGLLLDYIVTIAISAFAFPPYLAQALKAVGINALYDSKMSHIGLTVCIILLLLVINIVGTKHSTRISFFLAIIAIVTQLLIIALGAVLLLNLPHIWSQLKIGVPGALWSPTWPEFFKGTAMAMVAYNGIEAITQLTGETKNPAKVIPKAIRRTSAVLIVLYLGISLVALSSLSPHELGTKYLMDPLAGIVLQFPIGGQWLAPWVGLLAAFLLLIAANAGLIGSSRLTYAMGEYYQVPRIFYKLHQRFRTPYVALSTFSVLACLIVVLSRGEMLFLADLYNFGAMIAFFFAHLSLIVLRIRKPSLNRPYRAPFNISLGKSRSIPLCAVLGALGTLATWIVVVITKPEGRNLGIVWIALGLGMYWLYRRTKRIAPFGQLAIEKINIPKYVPMEIKNILLLARAEDIESSQVASRLAQEYKAKLTAISVLEVPQAIPLDALLPERELKAEKTLKRTEAIAREHHLTIELLLVRSRSIESAIKDQMKQGKYDLFITGATSKELADAGSFGSKAAKLLDELSCRVWFCKS